MMLTPAENTLTVAAQAGMNRRGNESYSALVWRRLRRSVSGMVGLSLVLLILLTAIFAEFFAPLDPYRTETAFARPDTISFLNADGSFSIRPGSTRSSNRTSWTP